MSLSVCVQAPHGRRQNIRVTPHSSVLQIIEEACAKQRLDPNDYDLKHHRKILDTSNTVLFAGLPNNAQLELVKAGKRRQDSSVTVAVQLESGKRLLHDYLPTTSLWDITQHWVAHQQQDSHNLEPVCIYARREVSGEEALKATSLRSLGLTGGNAALRVIWRSKEREVQQANVSAPLVPPPKKAEEIEDQLPHQEESDSMDPPETPVPKMEIDVGTLSDVMSETDDEEKGPEEDEVDEEEEEADVLEEEPTYPEKIMIIGERNAIVFDRTQMPPQRYNDMPDEFYNVTVDDVHVLMRDLTKQRNKLEEVPILTKAQRDEEQEQSIAEKVERYQHTVIRIEFPDCLVLQGTFHALETVQAVHDFVAQFLEVVNLDFYLFTTPPKRVLPMEARLVDLDCVPAALIHFGSPVPMTHYLNSSSRHTLSTLPPPKPFLNTSKKKDGNRKKGDPKTLVVPKWFQVRK